ncbi:MAG: exosortase/archaeosortase family protein [Candidatus Diapherotrites archaeon]|nr:exosortase/archaeosortase family protein [Candidatus Diapherotrites archaeon]
MKKKNNSLDFVLRFFAIYLCLYATLFVLVQTHIVTGFTELESNLLNGTRVSNFVILSNYSYEITPSCIGIVSVSMIFGLTFAIRKISLENKAKIAGFGSIVLLGFNILRVFYSIYLGSAKGPQIAQNAHTISWFFMGAMVLFVWYLLVKIVEKPDQIADVF